MMSAGGAEIPELGRQASAGALSGVDLSLSQGTMDQLLSEIGDVVQEVSTNNNVVDSSSVPMGYSVEVDSDEADMRHAIPHSFRVDTESVQIIPASQSVGQTLHTSEGNFVEMRRSESSLLRNVAPYLIPLEAVSCVSQPGASSINHPESQNPIYLVNGGVAGETNSVQQLQPVYARNPIEMAANSNGQSNPKEEVVIGSDSSGVSGSVIASSLSDNGCPKEPVGSSQVSVVVPPHAVTDFPSNTSYPGPYGFEIFFSKAQEAESKKTISYIYSIEEHKLYVRMKVHCPIHFKTGKKAPSGSRIRAMAIYSRPQDVGDVVKRCMNHTMEDKDTVEFSDHLVRCHHPAAVYEEVGTSRRHCVSTPLEEPSPGSDCVTGIYEFMCFSSCSGTINRRPTQLIFTLENKGEVLGRQVVELRICACPGRDIALSEGAQIPLSLKRKNKPMEKMEKVTQFTTLEPLAKRPVDNEVYTVQVRGRELYKIVMTIIRNYEVSRQYEELVSLIKKEQERALPEIPTSSARIDPPSENSAASVSSSSPGFCAAGMLPEQFTPETAVVDWLSSLDLSRYASRFTAMGYHCLDDLDGALDLELLESMGMSQDDRERLYGSFIQWRSIMQHRTLSSLSSLESQSSFPSTQANGATTSAADTLTNGTGLHGGYRLAKTVVRSTYKVPKKRAGLGPMRLLVPGKSE